MIASFSNRFIFIKTRKTGGTSAEIVLSTWCSGRDICAPLWSGDEALRKAAGGHPPVPGVRVSNHMSADEIREKFPELWQDAFKFTVERHPYEKVVSFAYFNIGTRRGNPMAEFRAEVDRVIASGLYLNHPLYMSAGKRAVDEIISYDELWPRLAEIGRSRGHSLPAELPKAKAHFRRDHRPARDILKPEQKDRIARAARIEFEMMGFVP